MPHIFVSYARKDIDLAEKVVLAFAENNLDTWIDWKSIPKGEYWEQEIYHGIEEADAFLFLVSPDSVRSQICNKEIAHAVKNSKRILPVLIHDTDVTNFLDETSKQEISKRNWVFCRDGQDDFIRAIEEIVETIHIDYEWLKYHTKFQVQALEWERSNHEKSFLLRGKELQAAELQLETNFSKEPFPTDLQRKYILQSRRLADRQRTSIIRITVTVALVMAGLAIYGLVQARLAEERATIALARQLAAQAQTLYATRSSKQMVALLLAAQSMEITPSVESSQILQNNLTARLIAHITHDGRVSSVAFSPDGKWVVSSGCGKHTNINGYCLENHIRVWEASTGDEVATIVYEGQLSSVVLSPDGKRLVSGGCDQYDSKNGQCSRGSTRVWEISTGQEIVRMTSDDWVSSIVLSSDGKYVVSGSDDYTIRVWELSTGKEIAHLMQDGPVGTVAISPDGRYIASGGSGSSDWTVRIWETLTGREVSRVSHNSYVSVVAFSPDGKYVASGSGDNTVLVWEVATGKEIARVVHDGFVTSVAFSPDGKYVVSGSGDNTARVWEISTGREVARVNYDDDVSLVTFSSDGKYVISGSLDGTARVWIAITGEEIARTTHDGPVYSVAISPDGSYAVSGSKDKMARVWEVRRTASTLATERMSVTDEVWSVAFSPNGRYIGAGTGPQDAGVYVWDVNTGKEQVHIKLNGVVGFIGFSPDSRYVISGEGALYRAWDITTGKEFKGIMNVAAFSPDGRYIAGIDKNNILVQEATTGNTVLHIVSKDLLLFVSFSPDGRYLMASDYSNTVRVWEVDGGREVSQMIHDGWPISIIFSQDSKYIVSGSADNSARVWEASTGKEIARIFHAGAVFSVAFSPDGRYVVSGSLDGMARVWKANTGKEVAHLNHDSGVYSVAFSPDGQYVISGSLDGTARSWDATSGKEITRMTHNDSVTSIAISPDGKYIASGSRDNTVRIWLWRSDDLIANACAYLPRNLSRTEWAQYIGNAMPYHAICPDLPVDADVLFSAVTPQSTSAPNQRIVPPRPNE